MWGNHFGPNLLKLMTVFNVTKWSFFIFSIFVDDTRKLQTVAADSHFYDLLSRFKTGLILLNDLNVTFYTVNIM